MTIRSVTVRHMRCHHNTRIDCGSEVTILNGANGSGKTSILEAVSLCSLGKSFVPVSDASLMQRGKDESSAAVDALSDNNVPYHVNVVMQAGQRKKYTSNHDSNVSVRELIGAMPVVALSPDHKSITFGAPAERRSFIDAIMAQSSKATRALLFDHRRTLKQRNVLLADYRDATMVDEWTQTFIAQSTSLIERRAEFIASITPLVQQEYRTIAGENEQVDVCYEPNEVNVAEGDVASQLLDVATKLRSAEIQRGTTLFGPQKDELQFTINDRLVRDTASQGQHKSFLIALKLAECRLLLERRKERPVVLLDDVFSELDAARSERVLARIVEMGMQCFVTTTNASLIARATEQSSNTLVVELRNGTVIEQQPSELLWKGAA